MVDPSRNWIKLHRNILSNRFWHDETFTRGQAWVDLLLLANHEDGFIRVRGKRIEVKRGQVGWSQEKLSERWKWSRKKVSNFLAELENMEQQIEQHKNNVSSLITIVNYEIYQSKAQQKEPQEHSKGTAEEPQKDSKGTAEEPQKNTNKNEKKVKEGKEGKEEPKTLPASGDAEQELYETKKGRKLTGERLATFNAFMDTFGDRRGKAEAADSWYDLKLTKTLIAEIMKGAENYAKTVRPELILNKATPKMAQGWLSGKRWEDVAVAVVQPASPVEMIVDPNKKGSDGSTPAERIAFHERRKALGLS